MKNSLYRLHHANCLDWMAAHPPASFEAIVTDPPYGLKEFTDTEKRKLRANKGGMWRIPPTLNGKQRAPLPRFTVLNTEERQAFSDFMLAFANAALRVLKPGGHIFIASNPLLSHRVCGAFEAMGFEKRGEIIRLVTTLRGGDRPKNAHAEFADVTVMPRSRFEPWPLFRKPYDGRVQDVLRKHGTGALRRPSKELPFSDVISSAPTHRKEREIAPHPSLKPQALMRALVHAALPLGKGTVLDPFMGAGSTVAAAVALGYRAVGIESDATYFDLAKRAVPLLAGL